MVTIAILRHAPLAEAGRVTGRRDAAADCSDVAALNGVRGRLQKLKFSAVWSSPARRCLQTCHALGLTPEIRDSLWEQDFGRWEGLESEYLPDLGKRSSAELASFRPPNGESFDDMAARVRPILESADRPTLIVAHAGTARAGLSLAVGPSALSFAIAPLSLTILSGAAGEWAVQGANLGSLG